MTSFRNRLRGARLSAGSWIRDLADLFAARPRYGLPPRRKRAIVGAGEFERVGRHLADLAVDPGGLEPQSRVLDWGCGWGRVAIPLTRHITQGSYTGVDVDAEAIRWCRESISRMNPRFEFIHLDAKNRYYNPEGKLDPCAVSVPIGDAGIDLVIAFSLFTHLLPDHASAVLDEMRRVLRPGGHLLMTHYVLSDERIERAKLCPNAPQFRVAIGNGHMAVEDHVRESAIGARRGFLIDQIGRLFSEPEIHDGAWDCTAGALSYQDVIVATRD